MTSQQQRDLLFLQTQKFENEFLQTTRDLFARYPNAKISISVLLNGNGNGNGSSNSTSRQIEIDRTMFEMLCAYQNIKMQPETPIRTTSIQSSIETSAKHTISTNLANNVGDLVNHSASSNSPSSTSSSSSSYDHPETGNLANAL